MKHIWMMNVIYQNKKRIPILYIYLTKVIVNEIYAF